MISTRWQHFAPAVTALIVTVAAAGCAASRPLAETATSAEPAPVATATPLTDDSAQGATLVPTAPPVTPVVTTTMAPSPPSPPSPTAPRPAAGGGAPSSTLGRPTDIEWARVDAILQDRLLGAGDFAFGVAVSIDGVPVHAASFGDRNSPNIVLPPPEPPTDSAAASTIATTTTSTTTTIPVVLEPVAGGARGRRHPSPSVAADRRGGRPRGGIAEAPGSVRGRMRSVGMRTGRLAAQLLRLAASPGSGRAGAAYQSALATSFGSSGSAS